MADIRTRTIDCYVCFLRHGQARLSISNILDLSLTGRGQAECLLAGKALDAANSAYLLRPFALCCVSSMPRAIETLQLVSSKAQRLFPQEAPRIPEPLLDARDRLKRGWLHFLTPLYDGWMQDMWERGRAAMQRILDQVHRQQEQQEEKQEQQPAKSKKNQRPPSVCVVCHNSVIQAILLSSLGLPPRYFRSVEQSNASRSVLRVTQSNGPKDVGSVRVKILELNICPSEDHAAAFLDVRPSNTGSAELDVGTVASMNRIGVAVRVFVVVAPSTLDTGSSAAAATSSDDSKDDCVGTEARKVKRSVDRLGGFLWKCGVRMDCLRFALHDGGQASMNCMLTLLKRLRVPFHPVAEPATYCRVKSLVDPLAMPSKVSCDAESGRTDKGHNRDCVDVDTPAENKQNTTPSYAITVHAVDLLSSRCKAAETVDAASEEKSAAAFSSSSAAATSAACEEEEAKLLWAQLRVFGKTSLEQREQSRGWHGFASGAAAQTGGRASLPCGVLVLSDATFGPVMSSLFDCRDCVFEAGESMTVSCVDLMQDMDSSESTDSTAGFLIRTVGY